MRLGIAGSGKIVSTILDSVSTDLFESVCVYGRNPDRAEEVCRRFGLNGFVSEYESLLGMDIDTVYIALPNSLHYEFAMKAVRAGKHVIVEKPAVTTVSEFCSLAACAKEHNVLLLEAMNVHFLPAFQKLKETLPEVGSVKIVSFNYSQYSSRYDAFQSGTILPAFDIHLAGGALMDLNVYNIHGIIGLFGIPKSVSYLANIEHDIDTSGILTMDYGSFKAAAIGAKDCKAPVMLTVQGDRGMIRMSTPVNMLTEFDLLLNDGTERHIRIEHPKPRHRYEFEEFVRIIDQKDEKKAEDLLSLSRAAMHVLDEARASAGIHFDSDDANAVMS